MSHRPASEIVHPVFGYADTIEGPHWDNDLAQTRGLPRGYDFGSHGEHIPRFIQTGRRAGGHSGAERSKPSDG